MFGEANLFLLFVFFCICEEKIWRGASKRNKFENEQIRDFKFVSCIILVIIAEKKNLCCVLDYWGHLKCS